MHLRATTMMLLSTLLFTFILPSWAFWKVPCTSPVLRERADPIINPGAVSNHVHTIMGGNGFGFDMDYRRARASSCSSCQVKEDKSNYWVPMLYFKAENGSFISVDQVGGALIYYLHRTDPGQDDTALVPFPEGFRMLAGDSARRQYSGTVPEQAINFTCLGQSKGETLGLPDYNCPDGLRAQIFFPSCWNGVDLDSPNHKSHIVYPNTANGGKCPTGFTNRTMSLFYEVTWAVDRFKDMWHGNSQPFVFSNGDPTGYGYHGDFVNGWDVSVLKKAITTCLDGNHAGDHNGDIHSCPPLLPLTSDEDSQGCLIPPSIDEQLTGIMSALPGCNSIQAGPGPAQPKGGCGAPTTYGKPTSFYSDFTSSKGWEYVGCGADIAFKERTLSDFSYSAPNMTVAMCIDYCNGHGSTYAGLEFANECYCGKQVAVDRAPRPDIVGNCMMKCAGDSSQYCGGPQRISLYRRCGSSCQNAPAGLVGGQT